MSSGAALGGDVGPDLGVSSGADLAPDPGAAV
jgi:hypothetical protein